MGRGQSMTSGSRLRQTGLPALSASVARQCRTLRLLGMVEDRLGLGNVAQAAGGTIPILTRWRVGHTVPVTLVGRVTVQRKAD